MNARLAIPLALVAAAMLLFVPGLGAVHLFDWDEINFAEISREMLLLDDFSRVHVDFRPFWEKPPLFFWMQVGAMELFGVGEFAVGLHVLLPDLADTDEPDAYLLRTHVLLRSKRLRDPILRRSWAHR